MSSTFKISNGQIEFDQSTGQVTMISGTRKAAQDLAAALLQDYLQDNNTGSHLRSLLASPIPQAGDLFFRFYIAEAVQRLQSSQEGDNYITDAEKITAITELDLVNTDGGTTLFYVAVSTADGGVERVGAVSKTQLNQQYERF